LKTNKWDILPYSKVGGLTFGIIQDEARNILGKEQLYDFDDIENETILYWQDNGLQLVFDEQGLAMVSFYPNIENIYIEETYLDWNNTAQILKQILKNDPSVKKGTGSFFVSFKYGIILRDFEQKETNIKEIAAFRKGYWDSDSDLLQPIDSDETIATISTMEKTPDWFAEQLDEFIYLIKLQEEDLQNDSFQLCVYEGADPIDQDVVMEVARKTEEAMRFFSAKTGFYAYAWFDHQAGQLRVSTKKDANIQEKFGSKVVFVQHIEDLVTPIYEDDYEDEDVEFDPETWETKVKLIDGK